MNYPVRITRDRVFVWKIPSMCNLTELDGVDQIFPSWSAEYM